MKRIALWVVVLLPAFFATGCGCCKKGVVLRGDWSLEMNRVPNMAMHGPQYQTDCCDACNEATPGGCTDACTSGCDATGSVGSAPSRHGEYRETYPGNEQMHVPEPPQPTAAAQSRFHPVPTRPVFEPENYPELLEPVQPAAVSGSGWKSKRRA